MNAQHAEQNLAVIRTLMERSALYRRALGPIFLVTGGIGVLAALAGLILPMESRAGFLGLWIAAAVVAIVVAVLMTRRQALRDREPLWSAPARRVAHAMLPPLLVGAALTAVVGEIFVVMPVWMILYGCALHATGFVTPRAVRWLGAAFMAAGVISLAIFGIWYSARAAAGLMGATFGGLHLLCGLYLTTTQKGSNGQ